MTEDGRREEDRDRIRTALPSLCAELDRRIFAGHPLPELLAFAAERLAETLGLPLVWVGLREEGGDIRLPTAAGPERGYLSETEIRWDEGSPRGRGPTGRAIRTGEPARAEIGADPDFEPWRAAALEHGLRSSLALPLRRPSGTMGAVGVYARDPDAFTPQRTGQLQHFVDHLALALLRHENLRALERSERRLRQMAESIEEVFYLHDLALEEVLYLSPAFQEIWGRPAEDFEEDPRLWLESIHPEDRDRVVETIVEAGGAGFEMEYRIRRPDGGVRWVHDRAFPVPRPGEEADRVAGVVRDVTGEKEARTELRKERQRYRALFEDARDAVLVTDRDDRILQVNDAFLEISGYRREELVGARAADFYVDPERRQELLRALAEEGGVRDFEVRLRRQDGQPRHCLVTASVLEAGDEARIQATIRDVTEQRRQRAEIEHEAMHDWLTDLPNRALFRDRLRQALRRAERNGEAVGLLFVDLNRFKAVNDTHGHRVGDRVLVEAALRLRTAVRDADTVARIGGDEFVVILPEVGRRSSAAEIAGRVRDAFDAPVDADGVEVPMTVAVGAAVAEPAKAPGGLSVAEARADPDRLLDRADGAMYRAKEREGSAVVTDRAGARREG